MTKNDLIKKGLMAFALAVLLFLGIAFFLRGSLDGLVKSAIEHYGSAMTGASLKIGAVEIRTTDGQTIISNLEIGNPTGFKTSHALKVAKIDVVVDMSTLTTDVVVIRKIVIAAPNVIYEKGEQMTNFDAIQKNIANYLGSAKPDEKNTGGKKFIVEQLLVRDAKAEASAPILAGKTVAVPLPDIVLNDIGKAKGGVTSGELGQVIADALKQKLTAGFSFDSLAAATSKVGGAIKSLFK
ncbi:MAG: hypothetical protein A2Z94_04740 [Gallionellales bacterium GWA2_55_18]|nr:MAG: hypothetical protein A2Z94_04740 [Gallionellales bacterium GWA2_55_18]